jgi:hypothetical protein
MRVSVITKYTKARAARATTTRRVALATGFTALLLVCTGATPFTAFAADTCPNAQVREQLNDPWLADCRAYELVSTDLNHASLSVSPGGITSADGSTIVYRTNDAPAEAQSSSISNFVRSVRDEAKGWSGRSLSPPITEPSPDFWSYSTYAVADDLVRQIPAGDERRQPQHRGIYPNILGLG